MLKLALSVFFLIFTGCMITHTEISLYYALTGLELWFHKMVPTLLPFMILSGIMIRTGLTEGFTTFVYPLVKPLYRVSQNACYAMIMGFLCGFPMGARTIRDLYDRNLITLREAEYLLAFCNNIGPVYFCGFVLPLLHRELVLPYVFGMYGLPLLYGLFLRAVPYGDLGETPDNTLKGKRDCVPYTLQTFLGETDASISGSLQSILSLGGYMILFNVCNLLPHILSGGVPSLLAPLLEITGGLHLLQASRPLYALLLVSFGGFCCIAQTYSCIRDTPLSIADYTFHKLVLTAFTGLYYLFWYLCSSSSFMR